MQRDLDGSRSSLVFRRRLAARLVALGAPTALAAASACNGGYGGLTPLPTVMSTDTSGSSGGLRSATGTGGQAPSTSSSTGTGGTGGGAGGAGGSPPTACIPRPTDVPDCPAAAASETLNAFDSLCDAGWEPVPLSAVPSADPTQCCYVVQPELCGAAGRPFLVDEQARVAEATFGAPDEGWQAASRPSVDGLSAEDRAALTTAWAADALLEHASVASFSRLSLALMAAGAPSDLVELAHKAALDEVRHAQLCFGLASAYAEVAVGPGAFPFGKSVHVPTTLAEIAVSAVVEGCVGETVAAVVAAEQLARATDPAVRAALTEIAADEARHAELAWKTVAWAVQAGGAEVRSAAARALFDAIAGSVAQRRARDAAPPASEPPPVALAAHGRLDEATIAKVAAAAMTEVVAPAAWAVFHESDASEATACAVGETPIPPSAGKLGDRH
jgi:hypothetical protein